MPRVTHTSQAAREIKRLHNAQVRKLGLAICWVVAAAIAFGAFGAAMVWVTGRMFNLILDGAHGWKDTLGRGIAAVLVAPAVGVGAGGACAFVIGAPLVLLLRKLGVDDPLQRGRRRAKGSTPPAQYPPTHDVPG